MEFFTNILASLFLIQWCWRPYFNLEYWPSVLIWTLLCSATLQIWRLVRSVQTCATSHPQPDRLDSHLRAGLLPLHALLHGPEHRVCYGQQPLQQVRFICRSSCFWNHFWDPDIFWYGHMVNNTCNKVFCLSFCSLNTFLRAR